MERILVVVPNWFGETLFATPFLRALRTQRPQAFIATLGWPQCREILLHNPRVNALLDYDERGAHRGLPAKWRLLQQLRAQRFDTAFILRRSLSRSMLLALAGIPARIGYDHAKSRWLLTRRVPPPSGTLHKAFTYLPLLNAVGLHATAGPYEYTVSDEERQAAPQMLRSASSREMRSISGTEPRKSLRDFSGQSEAERLGPLVVLHPGANWPHKRWMPERFAALGDRLASARRVHLVVTGGPDDVGAAKAITARMRQPATMLAGRTTLRQLGGCLALAQLVIANDTGVLHMAAALSRPVVALYGPTSPALTGPLGDPRRTIVLHHAGCCPRIPCYEPDRPPHLGMQAITVDEVFEAASRLLSQDTRHG